MGTPQLFFAPVPKPPARKHFRGGRNLVEAASSSVTCCRVMLRNPSPFLFGRGCSMFYSFRRVVFGVLAACSAVGLFAQPVVGSLPAPPDVASFWSLRTMTYVDLSHPATADGDVNLATFIWSAAPCPAAARIKFFRQIATDSFATTLTLLAERGPFDVGFVTQAVSLAPPVTLQKGDLIGITNLTNCGTPTFRSLGGVTAYIYGDAQGVGRLTGQFVFHPAFAQASPTDLVLPYSLGPWETQTIDDLVAAMGQTGIGSVDVVASDIDLGPTIQAEIYTET